ncbi:MAG: hypothetical protein NZ578_11495 [Candidatus Binatia bacterium]|nr:hypothetical protein [Candidatus Binatia bacterium]
MAPAASVLHGTKPVEAIYDLTRLFALRDALTALDPSAPPRARVLLPCRMPTPRRVGILCGSFNPLTRAHTELAARARQVFQLECVLFTLARVTIEKEQVTGMGLEDRLLVLSLYAERHDDLGVAVVNRGLYFEQAQAFRTLLGPHSELFFIIGMDKLLQIFDPRYYDDREAALRHLFSIASLLIANRGAMDQQAFLRLVEQPQNRPYRPLLHFFSLPDTVTELSATAIRQAVAAGQAIGDRVPPETATFIDETRVYHPPIRCGEELIDAYALRLHLLELLLTVRSWAIQEADFRRLMQVALSTDDTGRQLRHLSADGDVIRFLRTCQAG